MHECNNLFAQDAKIVSNQGQTESYLKGTERAGWGRVK